jgi:Skp family chaperone for outer membrane proteins
MITSRLIQATAIAALVLCVRVSAQTSATPPATSATAAPATAVLPEAKVALIDAESFSDTKAGITRYLAALKTLEREFQPRQTELTNLQARLNAVGEDIKKLRAEPLPNQNLIQTKTDEAENIERELKRKAEDAQEALKKRTQVVLEPISRDVRTAIESYAKQRGFTLVLDSSQLQGVILSINPAIDITQAFIADYNSKNPATTGPPPQ